jgi:branched-chain amino acid transport system permease protein
LLVSLAPLFIFQVVCNNIKVLGGPAGLFPIPQPGYLLPFTIVAILIIGFLIYRLEHSRLGRAQEVIFDNPDAGACQGVNAYKFSVVLQTIAGAMGGLAGAIYAPLIGAIGPGDFGFVLLLNIAAFFFVGGYTTMWGLVIFTPLLWALRVFLPIEAANWTMIIYGVILVVTMILRPEGVITKQALRNIKIKGQAFQKWTRGFSKSDTRQART